MKQISKFSWNLLGTLLCVVVFFSAMSLPSYATTLNSESLISLANSEQQTQVSRQDLQAGVEKAQAQAEKEAQSLLDQEAITAVAETEKAIAAIEAGKTSEALQALERATGKLDILLARNPQLGLVPISSTVEIIDVAPKDELSLKEFRRQLKSAINAENYTAAREILDNLMSEVRTKTVNLPLATYPDAMKEAARLLDNNQPEAAKQVLEVALSTLVITEKSRPIPIINAQTHLLGAIAAAPIDKENAVRLLEIARKEIKLAKDLGYVGDAREYAELDKTIKDIEKKIRANTDVTDVLAKLEDKLGNFLNRISA